MFKIRFTNKSIFKIAVLVSLLLSKEMKAQDDWVFNSHFNYGLTLNLNWGNRQQFPGLKLFASYGISGCYHENVITNYGITLIAYSKTLGSNMNPLYNDIQLDLVNAISMGYGDKWGSYPKHLRTVDIAPYDNIILNNSYAALFTANFILNSSNRNQIVGSFIGSFPGFSINYSNDGAPPFNIIPVADHFDRWWTGGLNVFGHSRKGYNIVEFGFNQFTGYSPLLYELSNLIGIDIPPYNWEYLKDEESNKKKNFHAYNSSNYYLRINSPEFYGFEVGVIGKLRYNDDSFIIGLQDIIHYLQNFSLHPNHDDNKIYIGVNFKNSLNVPIQN